MPFDPKEFLADVLKNVPEDKKKAVEEAFNLDPVVRAVDAGFSRQSDYSRNMDSLKEAQAEAERAKGALEAEKARYADWYRDANAEYQRALTAAERYEREYGTLDEFDPASKHKLPDNLLTKEEVAKEFERRDRAAIDFADALTDIKIDYRERFGEKLNTKLLYDHVEKTRLPFTAAYEDFIRPRVTEAEKAKFEEQLKQAKEEGRQEGLSAATLPTSPDPSRPSPLDSLDNPTTQEDRVNAAVAAFRAANPR
jgi:hypothetical protein